jgi:ABC-type multidrug transport system fused ATPase/permease subunit
LEGAPPPAPRLFWGYPSILPTSAVRRFSCCLSRRPSVKTLAEYGSVAASAWLGQAVVRDLRNDVFGRILRQPLQFFLQSSTGELISRVSTDIERVQTASSETFAELLKQGAILIFLTIAIFIIDWKLSLFSLVLIPLVFYPYRLVW